jgi:hypothetical protein
MFFVFYFDADVIIKFNSQGLKECEYNGGFCFHFEH